MDNEQMSDKPAQQFHDSEGSLNNLPYQLHKMNSAMDSQPGYLKFSRRKFFINIQK